MVKDVLESPRLEEYPYQSASKMASSSDTTTTHMPTTCTNHNGIVVDMNNEITTTTTSEDQIQRGIFTISRHVAIVIAFWMTLVCSGGLIFGFGPFYSALVSESQWHELCPVNNSTVCAEQEVNLQSVYSTGFLLLVLGSAVFGTLLDCIGPRYTACTALCVSILGNILLTMGDSKLNTDICITIGFGCIAFGGMGVLFASLQIAQLFENSAIYCGIIASAFSMSGYIFVLLRIPIARSTFFTMYTILAATCLVIIYIIYPQDSIVKPNLVLSSPGIRPYKAIFNKPTGLWKSLKQQLKRKDIWVFAYIGSWLTLITIFAGAAIPNIMTQLSNNNNEIASKYTNYYYPLLSNTAFLFAPLAGICIDQYGFQKMAIVLIIVFQLFCISMMIPVMEFQIVSFMILAICQAILNALQYAYIMIVFPPTLYGCLQAFTTILVFLVGLLNFGFTPLAQYTFNGNNNYVFLILLLPTISMFFLVKYLREEDIVDNTMEENENTTDDPDGQTTRITIH